MNFDEGIGNNTLDFFIYPLLKAMISIFFVMIHISTPLIDNLAQKVEVGGTVIVLV